MFLITFTIYIITVIFYWICFIHMTNNIQKNREQAEKYFQKLIDKKLIDEENPLFFPENSFILSLLPLWNIFVAIKYISIARIVSEKESNNNREVS